MIRRVKITTVYVTDQEKALDFYVNKLGFEKRTDERFGEGVRWLEVAPPGAETCIVLASGFGDESRKPGGFSSIGFETDDIKGTFEEMRGHGVTFIEEPTMQPWGMWQAQFVDQDGNVFVMTQEM